MRERERQKDISYCNKEKRKKGELWVNRNVEERQTDRQTES